MDSKNELVAALEMLGELLEHRGYHFDLVVIGGGALLLQDLITRPTLDLDAVARVENNAWLSSKPLPEVLVSAVRDVAETLDLPREPKDEKDWLNGGPTLLRRFGLPDGFEGRATTMCFGGLTLRVAAREDLIALKLWAATDLHRGARRQVDAEDISRLAPTQSELRRAVEWCERLDGRGNFVKHAEALLSSLGWKDD